MARSTFGGTTSGWAELNDALLKLQEGMAQKVGQTAVRKGAHVVQHAIEEAAPESDIAEGEMHSKRPHAKIKNHVSIKKGKSGVANSIVYMIGTGKAFHSIIVERGTIHAAAKPFAVPAFEKVAPVVGATVAEWLRKGIIKRGGSVE